MTLTDIIEENECHYAQDDGSKYEIKELADDRKEKVKELREVLIEIATESDDNLLEKYCQVNLLHLHFQVHSILY